MRLASDAKLHCQYQQRYCVWSETSNGLQNILTVAPVSNIIKSLDSTTFLSRSM